MQTSEKQIDDLENNHFFAQDFLPINGTDYLELYVGNALQSAHFFQTALGFQPLEYSGLRTGVQDRGSYVLAQDKIRLVLTTSLSVFVARFLMFDFRKTKMSNEIPLPNTEQQTSNRATVASEIGFYLLIWHLIIALIIIL